MATQPMGCSTSGTAGTAALAKLSLDMPTFGERSGETESTLTKTYH